MVPCYGVESVSIHMFPFHASAGLGNNKVMTDHGKDYEVCCCELELVYYRSGNSVLRNIFVVY